MTDADYRSDYQSITTNNPIFHLQVKFARALLNTKLNSHLGFKEESPVNIIAIRFKLFSCKTSKLHIITNSLNLRFISSMTVSNVLYVVNIGAIRIQFYYQLSRLQLYHHNYLSGNL